MKKIFALLLVLLSFLLIGSSCTSYSAIEGNGNKTTKTFDVDEFTKIDASNSFNIKVKVGDTQSVLIGTDENLLQYVKVYVKNEVLYLELKNNTNLNGKINVNISVKNLDEVDLSGACKIDVVGIKADVFSVDMSGACKGNFQGETEKLTIDLSGATKVNSSELKAKEVEVDISGASKCDVYSSSSLNVSASGASKVIVYGDPSDVETDISGASSISRK